MEIRAELWLEASDQPYLALTVGRTSLYVSFDSFTYNAPAYPIGETIMLETPFKRWINFNEDNAGTPQKQICLDVQHLTFFDGNNQIYIDLRVGDIDVIARVLDYTIAHPTPPTEFRRGIQRTITPLHTLAPVLVDTVSYHPENRMDG